MATRPIFNSLVICGPSGVGKGTICNRLIAKFRNNLITSVSHTTRKPRVSEVNGVHYHFVGNEAMRHEISDKKFIEFAEVHGSMYGTSIDSVQSCWNAGMICVLDIDVSGVQQLVKFPMVKAKYVFLMPPDLSTLEQRLRARGTESEEQIESRMKTAQKEMDFATSDSNPFDIILINADLNETENTLIARLKDWFPERSW